MPSIINATTTNGLVTSADNSGSLQLQTNNGTTAVTIDTSQNVGINLTPASQFSTVRGLGLAGTNGNASYITSGGSQDLVLTSNAYLNTSGNFIYVNTDAVVQQRMTSGVVSWLSAASGTAGTTASLTERMRITSGGYFKASNNGTYNNISGSYHEFYNSGNTETLIVRNANASFNQEAVIINVDRNTTNNSYYFFKCSVPGVGNRLLIADSGNVTNSNGSYGTISDIKNKENIVDATPKLEKINQLQVRNFNFKGDDLKQIGFVAQEFEQVFPSLIEEHHDKDADGNDLGTTTKSIKTSVLVPILVKAIQELKAELDATKAEVQALKGVA